MLIPNPWQYLNVARLPNNSLGAFGLLDVIEEPDQGRLCCPLVFNSSNHKASYVPLYLSWPAYYLTTRYDLRISPHLDISLLNPGECTEMSILPPMCRSKPPLPHMILYRLIKVQEDLEGRWFPKGQPSNSSFIHL